jgi:ATP-dependent Lon protease
MGMHPEIFPERVPLLLLRDKVIFPAMGCTILLRHPDDLETLREIHRRDGLLGVCNPRHPVSGPLTIDNLYPIGTACRVRDFNPREDGSATCALEGVARIAIVRLLSAARPAVALINPVREPEDTGHLLLEMLRDSCLALLRECIAAGRPLSEAVLDLLGQVENPSRLADTIAVYLQPEFSRQQQILSLVDPVARLRLVHGLLYETRNRMKSRRQHGRVGSPDDGKRQERWQRHLLPPGVEQDDEPDELEKLRQRLHTAGMPDDSLESALREWQRLGRMNPASPDYQVLLSYLEYLAELPWQSLSADAIDLNRAEKILHEDHFGLDEVKDRILEHLAVRRLKADTRGPILCLVGPPGVGKTSLGKSIARAMGRRFIRMSLGGMRDEAEIRGHRRTYVGAMPGKIIQEIKRAGTRNPVFMFDEIDKLGHDFRGDPSSALLEVMDPEQNHTFTDHYLGTPFDLSAVLFIATANQIDPIPAPLKDRMEIITLPGYSEQEKNQIAFRYLLERQLRESGFSAGEVLITDEAMERLISDYTREAGVRQLEKNIGRILRKIARKKAGGEIPPRTVAGRELEDYLGPRTYHHETAATAGRIGVVTGLAWTPTGGDIISVEAVRMPAPGGPKISLTGSLGDVMKESALTALSLLRSLADDLGIDKTRFTDGEFHLHVPAGAIPKDGPSAGLTIFLALLSLVSGRAADHRVAVTGEITLSGRVLPVGGIREKLLAAHRAGITRIVMPAENLANLRDLPDDVRETVQVHGAKNIRDAIPQLIPAAPAPPPRRHLPPPTMIAGA